MPLRFLAYAVVGVLLYAGFGYAAENPPPPSSGRASAFATAQTGRFVVTTVTAVNLDPMTIPLVAATGGHRQLYLTIGMDAISVDAASRLRALRLNITDQVIRDLYRYANSSPNIVWDETRREIIRRLITRAVERIGGEGTLKYVQLGEARTVTTN